MEIKEIKGRELLTALDPTIINEEKVAQMTTEQVYESLLIGYDLEWGETQTGGYEWIM